MSNIYIPICVNMEHVELNFYTYYVFFYPLRKYYSARQTYLAISLFGAVPRSRLLTSSMAYTSIYIALPPYRYQYVVCAYFIHNKIILYVYCDVDISLIFKVNCFFLHKICTVYI